MYEINQILRGAETIKKNSMNPEETRYPEDTPETNAVLQSEEYEELYIDALVALSRKKERECSRLRGLLNRAIEIADEAVIPLQRSEYYMDGDIFYRQLERLRDDIARLADRYREQLNQLTK
jgi:transposase